MAVGMWTTRRVAQGAVGRPEGAVHSTGMSTAICGQGREAAIRVMAFPKALVAAECLCRRRARNSSTSVAAAFAITASFQYTHQVPSRRCTTSTHFFAIALLRCAIAVPEPSLSHAVFAVAPLQHDGAIVMKVDILHLDHIHDEAPDDDLVVLAGLQGQTFGETRQG